MSVNYDKNKPGDFNLFFFFLLFLDEDKIMNMVYFMNDLIFFSDISYYFILKDNIFKIFIKWLKAKIKL